MEFERAIFRVYERCLDGLRDENDSNIHSSKSCKFLEFLSIALGTFMLGSLILLHSQFVGSSGCLPLLLADAQNVSITNTSALLRYDQVLNINIDPSLLPPRETTSNHLRRKLVNYPENMWTSEEFKILNASANATSSHSTVFKPEQFDYQFSFGLGVLFLPETVRRSHGFETLNITMSASECFGGSTTQYLISTGGIDTVVINQLMNTFKRPGYMVTSIGEYFKWTQTDLKPYEHAGQWLGWKLNVLLLSCFMFFLLTTVTSLLVRVLISSGVVLLFPLFWLIQSLGFPALNMRIISLSYPWIGVPIELIRSRNQSAMPFIIAHISRVGVYYVLYQAAQASFGMWFYRPNGSPGQPEVWLFALIMIVEYFGMIYVRAKRSIQIFPRAFLLMFLLFHFYYYSFPGGFHMLALGVLFCYSVALMALCVGEFELHAYYTGVVNIDTPRMVFNSLPWASLRADLAHDFTLFMPLTEVAVGLYDAVVPSINPNTPPAGPQAAAAAPPTSPSAARGSSRSDLVDLESGRGGVDGIELPLRGSGATGNSSAGLMNRIPLPAGPNSGSSRTNSNSRNRSEYARLNGSSSHGSEVASHDDEDD